MLRPANISSLQRSDLHSLKITPLHRARNWSKADVSLVEYPQNSGQQVILKDMARCPFWFRVLIGRYFLRHEWQILQLLQDIEEIPAAYHRIDADAFIIEYRAGKQANDLENQKISVEMLARIEKLIDAIHERGIAHGDLHASNIIVAENNVDFALIDWATACYVRSKQRGWKKVLFRELAALDERFIAKIRMIHQPQSLTEYQCELLLNGGSRLYRVFKSTQYFFYGLLGRRRRSYRQKIERYRQTIQRNRDNQNKESEE